MGSIADKLSYLANAVDDIQLAITEKNVECDDDVELGLYGEKIRSIVTSDGLGISDFYDIEKVIGSTLSDVSVKSVEDISGSHTYDSNYLYTISKIIGSTLGDIFVADVEDVTINYEF